MHIADGIIASEICVAADVVALGGVYLIGRKARQEDIPKMGVLGSALFVASLIHFPVAGTSVHLGLYGLAGILLGIQALPVVFTALLFQALVFQHGGLVVLGLNALNMALGALAAWLVWQAKPVPLVIRCFLGGFVGILVPASLMGIEFYLTGYGKPILFLLSIYLLPAVIEGALTAVIVPFIQKVKPTLLESSK
jgi:cobalt/nickel transport system permease protein